MDKAARFTQCISGCAHDLFRMNDVRGQLCITALSLRLLDLKTQCFLHCHREKLEMDVQGCFSLLLSVWLHFLTK